MSFEIKPATRTSVKALIGLYGKSGSGKTLSSLLVARGLAGPSGKVRLIDTENGRGQLFADIVPGGYDVLPFDPPFTPMRYEEAIETAEKGADVVVVDSMSHEWGGEGGVLDWQENELNRMAGDDWKKRESCKMASWIKPKIAHKQMVARLLRCRCALICNLRGEERTHISKGDDGKNRVITDEFSSPIFDPRFLFELLVNFETIAVNGDGGFVIPRKITHPSIRPILPKSNEQIGVAWGEALAKWCKDPGHGTAAIPSNFTALRQAADGKANVPTIINDVAIDDVTTTKFNGADVWWVVLNGTKYGTMNKALGEMAMREIESGMRFCANVRPGKKSDSFELVSLEAMDLIP